MRFTWLILAILTGGIFFIVATPVDAEQSASKFESKVVFFFDATSVPGERVLDWASRDQKSSFVIPGTLMQPIREQQQFGFTVISASGETEHVIGTVIENKLELSNGAVIRIDGPESIQDVLIDLKFLYLKLYQPNLFIPT